MPPPFVVARHVIPEGQVLAPGLQSVLQTAPPGTVSLPMPDAPPTEVAPVDITPANTGVAREMDLDWGSPKDGVRGEGEARGG